MSHKSGIILLDKREGVSSAKAIAEVKKKLNLEKIGHAGTLDPMATGLLVCLAGDASRLARFAEGGRKIYSGTIRFGLTTSTDDITGDLLESGGRIPTLSEVETVIPKFLGRIMQVPPKISALKVGGKRAYKLARKGVDFELAAREVEIFDIKLAESSESDIAFVVECGKGTYIRSLARDIGAELGALACLASLRREAAQPFEIKNAYQIEDLAIGSMLSWEALLPDAVQIRLSQDACRALLMGQISALRGLEVRLPPASGSPFLIYFEEGTNRALGLLERQDSRLSFVANFPGEV